MTTPLQSAVNLFGKIVEQINPAAGAPAPAAAPKEGVLETASGEKTVVNQTATIESVKTAPLVEEAAAKISKAAEEVKNTSPAIAASDEAIVITHAEEKKSEVVVVEEPKAEADKAADDTDEEALKQALALSKQLHEKAHVKPAVVDVDAEKVALPPAALPPKPVVAEEDKAETLPLDQIVKDGYIIPGEADTFWLPVVPVVVEPAAIAPKSTTEKMVDDVALVAKFQNKKERKKLGKKEKRQARRIVKQQKSFENKLVEQKKNEKKDRKLAEKLQQKLNKANK